MTFLPIVARELRVASRKSGTYWVRLGAALVGLAVAGWIMLMPFLPTPQQKSIALFVALSIVTFLYCLLAGLLTTADCLSHEKREGTLGLLFLTDLKGHDIVLGKLAATSLNAFYGMLAIFPVMAISLLVGGVTGGEFWRVVLVAVNSLFFSLAVGMFCSAIGRDERKAMVLAFIILLAFSGGFPLMAAMMQDVVPKQILYPICFIPSPGYAAFMAFDDTSKLPKVNFYYWSVLCVHLMSWMLLAVSCFVVPHTWQDRSESAEKRERRERRLRLWQGGADRRKAFRERLLTANPFYWLAARDRGKSAFIWLFFMACGLLWLWGYWGVGRRDWWSEPTHIMTALVLHTVIKIWVASEAARRFATDRKSGALELLLSTPIQVQGILRGQLLALTRQFLGPAIFILALDLVFLLTKPRDSEWVCVWIAGMVVFVFDLFTLAWVAMWMGMTSRSVNRATAAAVVRVMVLPWVAYAALLTGFWLAMLAARFQRRSWFDDKLFTAAWLLLSVVNNVLFGRWAKRKLRRDFRDVATRRFDQPRTRFARAGKPPVVA
ncbi:MAG TPA: ABC transporter permease [Verrucomicrobiae bacterium]|jgi:ABC-type transport system involved in multi-copper enzyme maturation permease subunit